MHKKIYKFFHNHFHLKYHNKYRHAKKLFIFDLVLLGLALVILASSLFFFFWKPSITELIDLNISLGADRIKSGEQVRLTIDYINRSELKLLSATLGLELPSGFVIDRQRTPESIFTSNSTFAKIKELAPGAKGQVEIYGWLWTEPNKEEKIVARLSYEPEGTDRHEQKLSHYISKLYDSVLQGELKMASSSFVNQPLGFTYAITNKSTQTIKQINLINNWSDKLIEEKNKKLSLSANEKKEFEGKLITPNKAGKYSLTITPQILINNHLISQKINEQNFVVIAPDIISSAVFPTKISYIEGGQTIPLELNWENKSSFKLQNMRMLLTSNYPDIIDWKQTARANNLKTEKDNLIIDKQARTQLSDGNPGSKDQFTINLYIRPYFNLGQIEKAYLIIKPTMETNLDSVIGQKYSQEGNLAKIPLATQLNLNTETRYYTSTGDQLGRGSLPPQVGKTTKYWVFIQINNTTNPVKDISFKTTLSSGVELTGKDSVTIGQKIKYDKNSRTVSWAYSRLPANSLTGIYFEVQVTPSPDQIGKKLQLTNDLYLSATDELVNKKFDLKSGGLDNILQNNDRGKDNGYMVSS